MAENKTVKNENDVAGFLASVASEKRREDAGVVLEMMKKITGLEPAMWGSSLIGFGTSQVPACVVTSDHLRQHLGITANRNRLTRDRPRPH